MHGEMMSADNTPVDANDERRAAVTRNVAEDFSKVCQAHDCNSVTYSYETWNCRSRKTTQHLIVAAG